MMRQYSCAEAVSYIEETPKFTKKNDLFNTVELLRRLGHPEERFFVIHVAGTNGKGSVCAFLEGALEAAGYRTGLFISPHLVRINERFQIGREEISDADFGRVFSEVKEAVDGMTADGFAHPAYFELLFAMGMLYFAEAGVDGAVLETGLGGRLDATTAVARPLCCVITSIGLDHTEYLGNTIPEIAREKAGIIREGVPVIYDAGGREAAQVIAKRAEEMHAEAAAVYPGMAQICDRSDKGIAFVLNNRYYDNVRVSLPFPADYQAENCALAMTALGFLARRGLPDERLAALETKELCRAISRVSWEGRMEQILPDVYFDGAHNPDGIAAFMDTVRRVGRDRPISLLFAAVRDKDAPAMIRELCRDVTYRQITVTCTGGARSADPQTFAGLFREQTDAPVQTAGDARAAFAAALAEKKDSVLFCAGSLYLVGELKEVSFDRL